VVETADVLPERPRRQQAAEVVVLIPKTRTNT